MTLELVQSWIGSWTSGVRCLQLYVHWNCRLLGFDMKPDWTRTMYQIEPLSGIEEMSQLKPMATDGLWHASVQVQCWFVLTYTLSTFCLLRSLGLFFCPSPGHLFPQRCSSHLICLHHVYYYWLPSSWFLSSMLPQSNALWWTDSKHSFKHNRHMEKETKSRSVYCMHLFSFVCRE